MPRGMNRRLALVSWALLGVLCLGASPARATGGDDGGKASAPALDSGWKSRIVACVVISGDLDSAKMAQDVNAAASQARAGGAEVLVAEFTGRKWRLDVLVDVVRALKPEGESTPLLVFLNAEGPGNADRAVGTGAAVVGLVGDACYLSARGKIAFCAADDLSDLAPEGFDREGGERELRGLAWTSVQARGGDALLTMLVPRPAAALYAQRGADGGWKLLTEPPAAGDSTTLVRAGVSGAEAFAIESGMAEGVGLVAGTARSVSELLSKQMIRPRKMQRFEVISGLSAARKKFDEGVASVDDVRRKAKGAIDAVYSSRAADMLSKQRRVGQEHLAPLAQAAKDLVQMEKLVQEYPELLRGVPPGTTEVGQDARSVGQAWRSFFQSRRNDLETLHARASTLVEK